MSFSKRLTNFFNMFVCSSTASTTGSLDVSSDSSFFILESDKEKSFSAISCRFSLPVILPTKLPAALLTSCALPVLPIPSLPIVFPVIAALNPARIPPFLSVVNSELALTFGVFLSMLLMASLLVFKTLKFLFKT